MNIWQKGSWWLICLRPFSVLYYALSVLRRFWYIFLKPKPIAVPVIVVGNITVGGSGKTPVIIALVEALQNAGFNPGVISRGFKGRLGHKPTLVQSSHTPEEVGDEPCLIYQKTHIPLVIAKRRLDAANYLLKKSPTVDIILSDDGLQHYALPRNFEIVMFDESALGNQKLLPEGLLREPMSRLKTADVVLSKQNSVRASNEKALFGIQTQSVIFKSNHTYLLSEPTIKKPLEAFKDEVAHAVAGIAHPGHFFKMLEDKGILAHKHAYPDHYKFKEGELEFGDQLPILMTEKDAVKCQNIKSAHSIWVVDYKAELDPSLIDVIKDKFHGQKTT